MSTRPRYALVGLFVLLLGGATVATGVWLSFGAPETLSNVYTTYMTDSVSGLRVKSLVRYRGVDVGRVRSIALDPENSERVRLLLDIDRDVPIRENTVARLAKQGLTGLAYVELSGGGGEAPPLTARDGRPHPVIPSAPSLIASLDRSGTRLLEQVERAIAQLALAAERIAALFHEGNLAAVDATLADLQRLAAAAGSRAGTVGEGIDDLGRVLDNAAEAGERLPALVARADATLAGFERHATALADAARAIEQLAARLDGEVARLSKQVGRTAAMTEQELARFASETQPALADLLLELDDTAASLRRLGETLERDPSLLIHGRRERTLGPGEEAAR
jgi:phospholipid/cholesterol/gamma-HCH transport system substrate-binding protein